MNKLTKITTIAILSSMPLVAAQATVAVKDLGNGLFVPDYTDAQLKAEGCDPKVWQQLVNQYVLARGIKKKTEEAGKAQIQLETPKNDWESCFSGALGKVNDLKNKANKYWSIFSGDFDLVAAGKALMNKYMEEGCRAINNATSSAVGDVTGQIGGAMDAAYGGAVKGVDAVTGINGAGNTVIKTGDKNDDSLFGGEKITISDVVGKDNMPTTNVKDVANQYVDMFGNAVGGAQSSGQSLLDSLIK